MSTIVIIFVILSLAFSGITFLVAGSIYFALGVLLISLLYFFLLAYPRIKNSGIKKARFHDCYHFINTYIVSLSIKGSIKVAYEDTANTMSESFKKINDSITEMTEEEKLSYLSKIYPFHIYSLFLNIIFLWIEEGGDILKMSTQLINETRNVEDYLIASERMSKKKYVEFSILWIIAIGILIFLKFALKEFYKDLSNQIFFPIAVSFVFVFVLISIDLLLRVTTSYDLKGWSNNEKEY